MAPSSCRNGKIVVFAGHKGREVPMKLNVTIGDVMGQRVWNAMAEPVPIPIGVSGGGFGPLHMPVRTIMHVLHLFVLNMRAACFCRQTSLTSRPQKSI